MLTAYTAPSHSFPQTKGYFVSIRFLNSIQKAQ